jgi:hypothetical protein
LIWVTMYNSMKVQPNAKMNATVSMTILSLSFSHCGTAGGVQSTDTNDDEQRCRTQ